MLAGLGLLGTCEWGVEARGEAVSEAAVLALLDLLGNRLTVALTSRCELSVQPMVSAPVRLTVTLIPR